MADVLIIDDDPVFGVRALRCLEKAGMRARFHKGPFGSLHAIRETGCDVVLVDIDMPRLDGGLLVKMVRDAFGLGQTKIILMGDKTDTELNELAATVGAHGYVSKQAPDETISYRVADLLSRRTFRPVITAG